MEPTTNPYCFFGGSTKFKRNNLRRGTTYLAIIMTNICLLDIAYGKMFFGGKTNPTLIKHFVSCHCKTIIVVSLFLGIIDALTVLDFATLNVSWHKSPVAHAIIGIMYVVVTTVIAWASLIATINILFMFISPRDWWKFSKEIFENTCRDIKKDVLKGEYYLFILPWVMGWGMCCLMINRHFF